MVYSSNSGVCPGSTHPLGLFILAMLTVSVREFTRPMSSSMIFGLFPAAAMTVGFSISVGMLRIIPNGTDLDRSPAVRIILLLFLASTALGQDFSDLVPLNDLGTAPYRYGYF